MELTSGVADRGAAARAAHGGGRARADPVLSRRDPLPRGAGVLRGDRPGAREGVRRRAAGAPRVPPILHFGSWAGGDMDGNPDVHAKTIRETLARQQQVIVNSYFAECQELAQRLSQSASRVGSFRRARQAPRALHARCCPGRAPSRPARHDRMPYRVFLAQIGERLRGAYDGRASGYERRGSSATTSRSSRRASRPTRARNAGLFYVERLLRRIDTFGFHLATLDVRQQRERAAPGDRARLRRSAAGSRATAASGASCWPQALEKDRGPVRRARRARQAHARGVRGHHAGPAPLRRRCHRLLHRQRRQRRGRRARGTAAGALGRGLRQAHRRGGARHRAAVRDRGGARRLRRDHAGAARRPALPPPPARRTAAASAC